LQPSNVSKLYKRKNTKNYYNCIAKAD